MSERFENPFAHLEEATIGELQAAMASGQLTARQLAEMYLERIQALDRSGPTLNSILEVNPDALEIADALDQERQAGGSRGPLHGIPLLLKDNIATADHMQTTAGSLALLGSRPPRDAFVVGKLRDAGAVILGKTNLSEWANFRSTASSSGWSGRGGLGRNPYVLDRTPCGSSSGSAAAVAANLAAASLGTETDGSILCPASANGVVGIKATVGLTSRAGVIPVAHSQDSIGPFGRTVTDAAILLGAITGIDQRDLATQGSASKFHTDYTQFLDLDGLRGARLGIPRQVYFGYSAKIDAVINEYKLDALVMPTGSPAWRIDLINGDHFLGASSQPAALAGYPAISVPAGHTFELPVGITFMGRAFSEPTLIKLAYAFEQATKVRRSPGYLPTVP